MLNLLLLASRPKTLPASAGPVLLGLALAFSETQKLHWGLAVMTLLTSLLLQVSTNLVNDYYDGIRGIDDQRSLGPKRITGSKQLNSTTVKKAFIFTLSLSFILGIGLMYSAGLPIVMIGLSSVLFAYIYTGGPLPLSYFALGELLALVFFGPVAVWGTYFIQTNNYSLTPAVIGLAPGFISAAIMAINNLRDRENDSKTKKVTLAIVLGPNGARVLPVVFILLSTFIPLIHVQNFGASNSVICATFSSYFFLKTWVAITREPISRNFNNHLANTGKYLFTFCLIYSISLIYAS